METENHSKQEGEKVIKNVKVASVALAFSLAVVFSAFAGQEQNSSKPGGVIVEVIKWSGEVTAVDYKTKMVTLKGAEGKVITLNAKNAANLDQVKVGDMVKAKYIESLAIFARKADSPPSADEEQAIALAPKGDMPAVLLRQCKSRPMWRPLTTRNAPLPSKDPRIA